MVGLYELYNRNSDMCHPSIKHKDGKLQQLIAISKNTNKIGKPRKIIHTKMLRWKAASMA